MNDLLCGHGSLRRSCEICDRDGQLRAADKYVVELEHEKIALQRERDEARDERDIFKRTLDKRDEELEWYRNHAISLGNVIQQALAVRPYESNYGTAYRSMMFILGDALKGEGE